MQAPQSRLVSQRKRSYSTTAYSSQEEEATFFNVKHGGSSNNIDQAEGPHASNLLATAVGAQVLTYEFINNGTVHPAAIATPSSKSQQPPIAVPGQYEGIQMSNERTVSGVSSLKWSPDNLMLAVETQDGIISLHDSRGRFQEALVNEPLTQFPRSGTNRCAMSWAPKPQRLYFARGDTVMTWDSSSKRIAESFETASRINALAVNSEDVLLAVGQTSGCIDVVNRVTGISARLETPVSLIMSKLEYSTFNKSVLGGVGNDGVLRLWDTGSNGTTAIYHSFTATHDVPIAGMAFSPFNRYLICTAGLDKRYALYDVEKKNVVKNTLTEHALTSVTFKNDGISMAFGTDQGKVLLYDLRSTSRPISIVDTKISAPVTAVHFQGKQSSSMRRHQTIGLKRQNSVTGVSSTGNKGVQELFPARRDAESAGPISAPVQEKASFESRRPAAPAFISTTHGNTAANATTSLTPVSSKSVTPLTARPTFSSSSAAYVSVPSTPAKERPPTEAQNNANSNEGSNSYPNSRTVSPFAFQTMQSHSPSGDSSTSSSSVNTPPGSPGTSTTRLGATPLSGQTHYRHHHYQYPSVDSSSKSPSRSSRAKRRKSFGTLLASGGAASVPGTPDVLSDEKMEILRGQIVDRVRNVLLDQQQQPLEPKITNTPESSAMTTSEDDIRLWQQPATVSGATASTATMASSAIHPHRVASKQRAPVRDLWLQAGLEGAQNNSHAANGSLKTHSSAFLALSALPASSLSSATAAPLNAAIPTLTQSSAAAGGHFLSSSASFSSKILENVVEGCLMDFRAGIRNDIQNMHLELLRQFQIQKMEIEGLLKQYTDTKELREENERLEEENRRLRMNQ